MRTVNTIREAINQDIERELTNIALYEVLKKALTPFENKPISKRLATATEKKLINYTVGYDKMYGMYHITIWGNGISWNEKRSYLLGYQTGDGLFHIGNPDIEHSGFAYYNQCFGQAAKKRNATRQSFLQSVKAINKMAQTIDAYNAAKKQIEEYDNFSMPSWYSIEKAFGLK